MNAFKAYRAEFTLPSTPWPNIPVKDYPEDEHTRTILRQRLNFIQTKDVYCLVPPEIAAGIQFKLRQIERKLEGDKLSVKQRYKKFITR